MNVSTAIFLFTLLTGCCASKKIKNQSTTQINGMVQGIVHVNENNCPLYIESISKNSAFKTAYPLNLKDGMKKKGLKVEYTYTLSKSMNPDGCASDVVIQIEEIRVIP